MCPAETRRGWGRFPRLKTSGTPIAAVLVSAWPLEWSMHVISDEAHDRSEAKIPKIET
jgi:hypothetical protein